MPAALTLLGAAVLAAADQTDASPTDAFLNVLAIVLIVLPIWDWRVALRLWRAARKPPRIDALWASTYSSMGVACGATLAAILGLNRIEAVLSNTEGFLPPIVSVSMLALALIVVSLPNIPKDRFLRRIAARPVQYHKRDGELPHPHRRWDDPPEE